MFVLLATAFAGDLAVGASTVIDMAGNASFGSTTVEVDPGLYAFMPIDGTYQAYNAWSTPPSGCNAQGNGCSTGFLTNYRAEPIGDGTTLMGSGNRWSNATLAVENTVENTLCITAPRTLRIANADAPAHTNNSGGLSIRITRLTDGDCTTPDGDWAIATANATYGATPLTEAATARLRPSTIRVWRDAMEQAVIDAGCDPLDARPWAGAWAAGGVDGTSFAVEEVAGTYQGSSVGGTVDGTVFGDLFGTRVRSRVVTDLGAPTDAALAQWVRVAGRRGVWIGGETTCPVDASVALDDWLRAR